MCIPEATWKDLDFYTKYVASYERETVILVNPFILNVFFFSYVSLESQMFF